MSREPPRQAAIEKLIERQSYPQELLDALQLYKADPKHWQLYTFDTPEDVTNSLTLVWSDLEQLVAYSLCLHAAKNTVGKLFKALPLARATCVIAMYGLR